MALYLISYDINHKNEDEYPHLWGLLQKWGATRILYSEWIVSGNARSAASIYGELSPTIKQNDRLLIQEVGLDCAWDRLMTADDKFRIIVKTNARF